MNLQLLIRVDVVMMMTQVGPIVTVGEVIGSECSDNESDDVQCASASSAPSASSATFMWEDMTNYVGQREEFVDNYGP